MAATTDVTQKRQIPAWVMALILGVIGVGFAAVMIIVLLAIFPQLRPGTIVFTVRMGDIFYHTPQWVKPPENPDEVLSVHWIGWDADGFRIPARQAERYEILAVGDSFTEAANAAWPWPDVLAETSGRAVRNLGFRGYGPVEQAHIIKLYGAESGASTVVIGYFEGNDLSDAIRADPNNITLPSEAESFKIIPTDLSAITDRDERFPMQVRLGDQDFDIAFLDGYLWALNGKMATFRRSENMNIVVESWQTIQEVMGDDVCVVIAYFPSKPHIYVPYLLPEYHGPIMREAKAAVGGVDQPLRQRVEATDFETYVTNLDNQRDAVAERAARMGFAFFDLTPVLQTAAARSEMVYYTYDTHWNQRGHDLVGQAIAEYLTSAPCG